MSAEGDAAIARAKANLAKQTSGAVQPDLVDAKVYSPFKTFFEGKAISVSAVNETGPFDVLARHHKFITLLSKGNVVVRSDKGTQEIPTERGIMRVSNNKVVVYLGI